METIQIWCDFWAVSMMRLIEDARETGISDEEVQAMIQREFTNSAITVYAEEFKLREEKEGGAFFWYGTF